MNIANYPEEKEEIKNGLAAYTSLFSEANPTRWLDLKIYLNRAMESLYLCITNGRK
jgi:hypothetical protein